MPGDSLTYITHSVRSRVVIHWRAIILLLIFVCVAFLVGGSDEFPRFCC